MKASFPFGFSPSLLVPLAERTATLLGDLPSNMQYSESVRFRGAFHGW